MISKHLTADPPQIGSRRPELSSLGPVFDKALAKSPKDRYDRCIDFARALAHHIGTEERSAAPTRPWWRSAATGPRHARLEANPRRRILLAAAVALVVIAVAAVGFVLFDRIREHSAEAKPHPSSAPSTPAQATPGGVTLPVVVVGANCATLGAAGITEGGAPAYCAHLPTTNGTIWSLYPGEISSPTVTAGPNDEVYPSELRGLSWCGPSRPARAGLAATTTSCRATRRLTPTPSS